jgi:outer membrane protein OmpA-like peptidoglycan-associated protein/tetratricopeptide (TPR) repeat protein
MKKLAFISLLLFSAYAPVYAGGDDAGLVKKADRAFRKAKLADALSFYLKALIANPKDAYANFQAGAIYYLTDSARTKALAYFENTIKYSGAHEDDTIVDAYYYLGNCYILKKDYNSAITSFRKYLGHLVNDKVNADLLKEVQRNIEVCKQAPELIQRSPDSASFIINGKYQPTYVKNLGSLINTPYPEYAQVLLNHDSTILFTSRRPASQKGRKDFPTGYYYEDIFVSQKDKTGQWLPPSLFSTQLNIKPSKLNLASVCVSSDDKTLFVFYKGLMYESHRSGSTWTKPERVGKNIKSIKKFMPSVFLSYDGKKLLLVSDKKGGYGGRDIYMSTLDDKGIWSDPQNLGSVINTAYDEDAPYLLPDNKTLFFASKGHNGLGGYDIFKSVLDNGKWSTPVNLGVPINSPADDIFFTYDTAMKKGYFSSSRINEGYGDMDLYSLSFTCDNIDSTTLQGVIADANKTNVSRATEVLTDLSTQKSVTFSGAEDGRYNFRLKPDTKYSLSVHMPGYLTSGTTITTPHQCDAYNLYQAIKLSHTAVDSAHQGQKSIVENAFYHSNQPGFKNANGDSTLSKLISTCNDKNTIWLKDSTINIIYTEAQMDSLNGRRVVTVNQTNVTTTTKTKPVINGKTPDVLFELNGSKIATAYYAELDSIAKTMCAYSKIKLQINGYADNTGKEEHNKTLSRLRAKAVAQYLVKKGVKAHNIMAEGKGVSDAAGPNDGTHNYLNRRAELILIQ